MKYFLAIVAILALSACGTMGQKPSPADDAMDAAHVKAQAAVQACKEKHAKGELTSYVDTALCANPRIVAAYQQANYPYMDLVYLGVSAKLAGAVKVDAGEITEAQLDGQVAELRVRVAAEEQRRRAAGETQTAAAGSTDALLAGLGAFDAINTASHANAAPVVAIHAESTLAAAEPNARSDIDTVTPPPPPERQAMAMAPPPPAPPPSRPGTNGYRLQFGVFAREDNATRLTKAITTPQTQVAIEAAQDRAGRPLYYVRSPAYPDLDKAQAAAKAAQAAAQHQGFKEPVSYVVLPVGDVH